VDATAQYAAAIVALRARVGLAGMGEERRRGVKIRNEFNIYIGEVA